MYIRIHVRLDAGMTRLLPFKLVSLFTTPYKKSQNSKLYCTIKRHKIQSSPAFIPVQTTLAERSAPGSRSGSACRTGRSSSSRHGDLPAANRSIKTFLSRPFIRIDFQKTFSILYFLLRDKLRRAERVQRHNDLLLGQLVLVETNQSALFSGDVRYIHIVCRLAERREDLITETLPFRLLHLDRFAAHICSGSVIGMQAFMPWQEHL